MKIAIVEDNLDYLKIVEQKVQELLDCDLFKYSNSHDYKQALNDHILFDIIIMDIELDDESGIDLALKTNQYLPYCQIIYLSSYNKYISDAYETEHIYYINKEQMTSYLPSALKKATTMITKKKSKILTVTWNKVRYVIKQVDIVYLERNRRVTSIYTKDNVFKTSDSLDDLLTYLNDDFARSHKSYLVNMNYIYVINRSEIVLKDKRIIPVSRSHLQLMKKAYNDFLTR